MLNRIDDILKQHGVDYTVLKIEEFAKYYTLNPDNDEDESFRDCIASGCREVYRGKLLRCSGVIAFEKLNHKYGTHYNIVSDDWFDIHNESIDVWEIKNKLDEPSNACKYCNVNNIEYFQWDYANKGRGLNDYVLD